MSRVLFKAGEFAVTDEGIECTVHDFYFIDRQRIKEDWVTQMKPKRWVDINAFTIAYNYARGYYDGK